MDLLKLLEKKLHIFLKDNDEVGLLIYDNLYCFNDL